MRRPLYQFNIILLLGALSTLGCRDLERFDTSGDEAYCGAMISAPVFHEGFVQDGAPPTLRLRMELDSNNLTATPGRITTDDSERGLCSDSSSPLFDDARLRAIPETLHDPVSTMDFGEGREHSLLAYVDSTCSGTMLALVSLMRNDDVELRLFKPAPAAAAEAPAAERPGFAVFQLKRQTEESCGF
jgi:hypothetical protein